MLDDGTTDQYNANASDGKFSEVEMTFQEIADHFGVTTRAITISHANAMAKLWKLAEDMEFLELLREAVER